MRLYICRERRRVSLSLHLLLVVHCVFVLHVCSKRKCLHASKPLSSAATAVPSAQPIIVSMTTGVKQNPGDDNVIGMRLWTGVLLLKSHHRAVLVTSLWCRSAALVRSWNNSFLSFFRRHEKSFFILKPRSSHSFVLLCALNCLGFSSAAFLETRRKKMLQESVRERERERALNAAR